MVSRYAGAAGEGGLQDGGVGGGRGSDYGSVHTK